ncbi:MAG: acetyl-CoA carboxylase biotin carboxyl carrier protein subunit [Candidatus Kapaibacteriota bacterium]|jgi:biotin carboxyl carrier protein
MENEKHLVEFKLEDTSYLTTLTKKYGRIKKYQPKDLSKVRAFIPGLIQKIYIKPGDEIKKGQPLFVLEAMKMRNDVFSPIDGKVKAVLVKSGDVVAKDQILVELDINI